MAVRVTSLPISEPVSIGEVLEFLRIDVELDGAPPVMLDSLVQAARELAESRTRRALVTQTLELYLDGFPAGDGEIRIPRPPLQEVLEVAYRADGPEHILEPSAYIVDAASEPGRIVPVPGRVWPVTDGTPGAVRIRYVAGYQMGVPSGIRTAMLMLIGGWWEHPESVGRHKMHEVPWAVQVLLDTYRVYGPVTG